VFEEKRSMLWAGLLTGPLSEEGQSQRGTVGRPCHNNRGRPCCNNVCATGSASANFHNQKPIIAIFRWKALAEPVAREKLAVKTHFYDVAM